MDSIYRFASQESLRQDIHLTQGVNETYGAFTCRVSGLKVKFEEPDTFLRRMNIGSSNSSQESFKDHFGYASALEEHTSLPGEQVCAAQRYYFNLRADVLKQASSHNNDPADQALIEQTEIHGRYRATCDKPKKTVFQRLWCFMPCIKVKT
ncbi:hypothetical protein V462_10855 [Pantoea ananatis 15320]|uniref:Type III secretion system protein n=1 Tax=Pantoea ananas TaxID=553 RepID=A0A0D4ZZN8_PANAN|nr:hypothetical protein [Pantoea ananatis]AJW29737.1 type III secretion system protein [Pantoea ananatis]PKC36122.1 hypothetical protein V462_10855 [Pantoea ananatis 15320]